MVIFLYKEADVCPIPKRATYLMSPTIDQFLCLLRETKFWKDLYLYNYLRDNNLLSSLQSGFLPGDSTVNQLTFLYNTFCQVLDSGKEVRAVFCDLSKAFDSVWHAGLLAKIHAAGVTGNVHAWFADYLSDRKQRVVLSGVGSDWTFIRAGIPQESI